MSKPSQKTEDPPIFCTYTEMRSTSRLKPHPKNPNHHPDGQIALLAKIIKEQGWRSPIVISKSSKLIVAGHGRLQAAKLLGLSKVPVEIQYFPDQASELAHLVADNRISEIAELDHGELAELLQDPQFEGFDLDLTGFDEGELEALFEGANVLDLGENEDGKTPEDFAKDRKTGEVRQLQIISDLETHDRLVKKLAQVMTAHDLGTNSDAAIQAILGYELPRSN